MDSSESFAQCAEKTLSAVGISKEKVDACIASSGGVATTCSGGSNCRNSMLEKEILDRSNYGIITLPTIVVNGVVLRGVSCAGNLSRICVGISTRRMRSMAQPYRNQQW